MRNVARLVSIFCIVLSIAACGSSPPVRYFTLGSAGLEYRQDAAEAPVMSLGPIRLPDYLDRSQMVTRGAGNELIVNGQSRWAEPLDQAIHRAVALTVDSLVDDFVVVAYPSTAMIDPDYRLVGRVYRFDTDTSGLAVLEVQWGAADTESNVVISARRTRYTKQATNAQDPGAIAEALSDTLAQYGQDIASELNEVFVQTDVE